MHYNIDPYIKLSEHYKLTVAHYGKKLEDENKIFNQIVLTQKRIGPFTYFKENIYQLAKEYDAVLALSDLHVLPYILLGFRLNRNFSLTFWGIGVSASYTKKFDEDRKLDIIRFRIMDKAESLVFYSDYPINRYIEHNVKREKLFVAQNTVYIDERIEIPIEKEHLLFVGSLYQEKRIYELLDAYLFAYRKNQKIAPLLIVGDGEERQNIENWIQMNQLQNNIIMKGAIYESVILKEIYRYAIASISPGQAGLSVLSSMAYGVPFVTTDDAITGGELFNIKHGYNGLLYDGEIEHLSKIIEILSLDHEKTQKMGLNAQNYYFEHRTMDKMIDGLRKAIDYSIIVNSLK